MGLQRVGHDWTTELTDWTDIIGYWRVVVGLKGTQIISSIPSSKAFLGCSCESEVLVAQSCLTLCDPMDCSPPGSFVHGILQMRIQEWVVISYSRRSSWPRDQTQVSWIAGRFFPVWATRERLRILVGNPHLPYLKSISSRKKAKPLGEKSVFNQLEFVWSCQIKQRLQLGSIS